jgi:hypothetical protein
MANNSKLTADGASCGEATASIHRPLLFGRLARLATGLAQLQLAWTLVRHPSVLFRDTPPTQIELIIAVALAFALLSWTINLGFQRSWGSKPFRVAVAFAALAVGTSFALYGSWWGTPVATVLFVVTVYVHGHMGMCHVLAGLLGTPGCEMRAPAQVWAKIRGSADSFVTCPGPWRHLDRWESAAYARMKNPVQH